MNLEILLPIFKQSNIIEATLDSLKRALIPDVAVTLTVLDDNYPEDQLEIKATCEILSSYENLLPINYEKSESNLGYVEAMRNLYRRSSNDHIMYLAGDDLINKRFFANIVKAYQAGAMFTSRSFYMFENNLTNITRMVPPMWDSNGLFKLNSLSARDLDVLMFSLSQLSGLTFNKSLVSKGIGPHVFTAHVYPLMEIAQVAPGYYFNEPQIMCRQESSQTRTVKKIYKPSPTKQWGALIESEVQSSCIRALLKKRYAGNFVGLNQIFLYAGRREALTEIREMICLDKEALLNPKLFLALLLFFFPKDWVRSLSNYVKQIGFKRLRDTISLNPQLDDFR